MSHNNSESKDLEKVDFYSNEWINGDKVKKNITWRAHNNQITKAFLKHITTHKSKPTLEELSKETGLSVNSCHKYIKEFKFDTSKSDYKMYGDRAIHTLVNMIEDHDTNNRDRLRAIELYGKFFFDLKSLDDATINNYQYKTQHRSR